MNNTIDIEGISKSYGDVHALKGISLHVGAGEIFGLIGPDGAGKTTLFRIMTTLMLPDTGTGKVCGLDIVKDCSRLRRIIGYMPGKFSLYQDLTVKENLDYFATLFGTTVRDNYENIKEIYSQIEPFADRRAGKLSGGMKQKLALCCALVHRPSVLFLDEPTTGVDAVSRKDFWTMLSRIRSSGVTVFVSTPYMDEAARCDRLALIREGSVIGMGSPEEITVTTGASEAVLFAFLTCMDPGDELITTEPTYANYLAFAEVAGVKVRTLKTSIENGFALPQVEHFEELITPRTKAILICNPNNPSGTLYDRKEMQMLADIVRKHGLYLFSDEVYREFVYDGMEYFSAGHFDGLDENVVLLDSFSKRYSECGIRVGALITRNRAITQGVLKLCQARLSPPLLGQIVAEASCDEDPSYLDNVIKEYDSRRKVLIESLTRIPGVKVSTPHGAFYAMAALPVDDAEKFCAWCLSDFQYEGESIMMAPANGFYITPGLGINEVRMAYVLKSEDLRRAVTVLEKALEAYPGRTLR